jgi:hypothetical protein
MSIQKTHTNKRTAEREAGHPSEVISPDRGTLIVTSAIHPSKSVPYLRLTAPQQRLFQTYCSLICWIRQRHITNIVLCDNTGTDHAFSGLTALAERHNKTLEILVFGGNHEETCLRGKGYGEGEIMKHVIEHSRLLKENTAFYKITGRIFVEEFEAIHNAHRDKSVVFLPRMATWQKMLFRSAYKCPLLAACWKRVWKGPVATVFYKCTTQYYANNLIDRFRRVDDHRGYYLEHAFVDPLKKNGFDVFSARPRLVGRRGTSDVLYGNLDYTDEVKNLAALLLKNETKKINK